MTHEHEDASEAVESSQDSGAPPVEVSDGPVSSAVENPVTSEVSHEGADALTFLNDLEAKISALRDWKVDHERQVVELTDWTKRLNERDAELQQARASLDDARAAMKERERDVDHRDHEVGQQIAGLEKERQRLDESWAQIQCDRDELGREWDQYHNKRAELDQHWEQYNERSATLEAEREAVEQCRSEFEKREQAIAAQQDQLNQARAEIEEKRRKIQADLDQIGDEWRQIDHRRKAQDQLADTLEEDRQRIEQLRQRMNDQAAEQGAVVDPEVSERAERLAQELEELSASSQETIAQLEQRIGELETQTVALTEQRDAAGEDDDTLRQLEAELQAKEEAVANREAELDRRRHEIQEKVAQAKDELKAQREVLRQEQEAFEKAQRAATEQVAQAKAEIAAQAKAGAATGVDKSSKSDALIKSDKSEHDKAAQAAHPQAGKRDPLLREAMGMRAKRLQKYRESLRSQRDALVRDKAKVGILHKQYAALLEQRKVVMEVKDYLEASESVMVQRWASHRTVTVMAAAVVALATILALSYQVAQKTVAITWNGSSVLEYTPTESKESLDMTHATAQQVELRNVLSDAVVLETHSLIQQQGVGYFDNAAGLKNYLQASLSLQAIGPNRIEFDLQAGDQAQLTTVLESLGKAVALFHESHATREAGEDGVAVKVEVIQAAVVDAKPVEDKRLEMAGLYAGSATGVVLVLSLILWVLLRQSSRVLESSSHPMLGALADDSQWPSEDAVAR